MSVFPAPTLAKRLLRRGVRKKTPHPGLICSIFAPGRIGATHPALIKENIAIFPIKKVVGQLGLFPTPGGSFLALDLLHQVVQNSLAIVEINAGTTLLINFSLVLNRLAHTR